MKITFKIFSTALFVLFFATNSNAKSGLARTNDQDAFTNVRSGKGINFGIVATIDRNDFFYCDSLDIEWVKVIVLKWTEKGNQVEGYIHKSRVQLIENLSLKDQGILIKDIITHKKFLVEKFGKSWQNKDSLQSAVSIRKLSLIHI